MIKKNLSASSKTYWIYGLHAVKAALSNPNRLCHQIWLTKGVYSQMKGLLESRKPPSFPKESCTLHMASPQEISQKITQQDAVHQGCAVQVSPLSETHVEDLLKDSQTTQLIIALDQVTDPHNVGAILRSCAAFGATALLQSQNHAPPEESGILAKTASGALELVPIVNVPNLARSLQKLKDNGFWCGGLDEKGTQPLGKTNLKGKNILVMGSEGKGLRRLTQQSCDYLVHLPTTPSFPTLNVSTAAAICLYQFSLSAGGQRTPSPALQKD